MNVSCPRCYQKLAEGNIREDEAEELIEEHKNIVNIIFKEGITMIKNKTKLKCPKCEYIWEYEGMSYYAKCPRCKRDFKAEDNKEKE